VLKDNFKKSMFILIRRQMTANKMKVLVKRYKKIKPYPMDIILKNKNNNLANLNKAKIN
jgi:hypothetical protein